MLSRVRPFDANHQIRFFLGCSVHYLQTCDRDVWPGSRCPLLLSTSELVVHCGTSPQLLPVLFTPSPPLSWCLLRLCADPGSRHKWCREASDWGFTKFKQYSDVVNPDNGFLLDDTMKVQVEVNVQVCLNVLIGIWVTPGVRGSGGL